MTFEITSWKKEGCDLTVKVDKLSDRETFSREINETYGEGGGLNANYRTVEAIAKVSSFLGFCNMLYGMHFVFKTTGMDTIILDFATPELKARAQKILEEYL